MGGKGQSQQAFGGTRPQSDDGIDDGGREAQLLQVCYKGVMGTMG